MSTSLPYYWYFTSSSDDTTTTTFKYGPFEKKASSSKVKVPSVDPPKEKIVNFDLEDLVL